MVFLCVPDDDCWNVGNDEYLCPCSIYPTELRHSEKNIQIFPACIATTSHLIG